MSKKTTFLLILLMIVLLSGCQYKESESESMSNSNDFSKPIDFGNSGNTENTESMEPSAEPSEKMSEMFTNTALSDKPTEPPTEALTEMSKESTEIESSSKYPPMYREGVHSYQNWRELTSEEKTHAEINYEEALDRARAMFAERQNRYSGYYEDDVLVSVFYDTEDEVWVFTFGEWPLIPGGGYSYAISRAGGYVLGEWPNE